MPKIKNITLFILLAFLGNLGSVLCASSSAATQTPTPEAEIIENNYGSEYYENLLAEETGSWLSTSDRLKDWSHCNYSSKETCARSSLVRVGTKLYDPMSFKGAENDTYGKQYSVSFSFEIN
jgi:hypothetical protein